MRRGPKASARLGKGSAAVPTFALELVHFWTSCLLAGVARMNMSEVQTRWYLSWMGAA